jgi:serine/threonine protein kinase
MSNKDYHIIIKLCDLFPDIFCHDNKYHDKYNIIEKLGSGASGIVFLCKKKNEYYAVKFIEIYSEFLEDYEESSESSAYIDKINREFECMKKCDCFFVIKIFEKYQHYNKNNNIDFIAIIMEYANCMDLRREIKKRSYFSNSEKKYFTENDTMIIFIQILMALNCVHKNNIIHRDIKSANLLVFSNGIVKLGDFGFSKILENFEKTGTFCGTPYYLAPEIWENKKYSNKADIFSLGVLFYEIITLERPFNGSSTYEIMDNIITKEPKYLSNYISSDISDIVNSMLDKNPDMRPSIEELLNYQIIKYYIGIFYKAIMQSNLKYEKNILYEIKNLHKKENIKLIANNISNSSGSNNNSSGHTNISTSTFFINYEEEQKNKDKDKDILCQSIIYKYSDNRWKKRYFILYENNDEYYLGISFDKESCFLKDKYLEKKIDKYDYFYPVPKKYSPENKANVFVLCDKNNYSIFRTSLKHYYIWLSIFENIPV